VGKTLINVCYFVAVLLSLALVVGLEVSSRTNFESLVLALKVKSLLTTLLCCHINTLFLYDNDHVVIFLKLSV